jgi:hypothetical protein
MGSHLSGSGKPSDYEGEEDLVRDEASVNHAQRTELLRANGGDPRLIQDLLGDAQLLDLLGRSCNRQIAELKAFQNGYGSKPWGVLHENEHVQKDVKTFGESIKDLEKEYRNGLKTLADTSRDLIQLVLDKSFPFKGLLADP